MSEQKIPVDHHLRYPAQPDLTRFAWLSIAAAVTTILLKGGAAALTGSVGLLSDAAESVVNLVAAVIALFALRVAAKPPDHDHPFGHSKAEYFSAVIEGIMIFIAAAFIIASAVTRLMNPKMPDQLGIGLAITALAAVINGVVGWYLQKQGRTHNSATLVADGKHLMTDVVTSVAVIAGVGLVAITKNPILDPIIALLAGVNILWTGWRLVKSSVDGLMDKAVSDEKAAELDAVLAKYTHVGEVGVHAVRTRVSGAREFMEFHLLVPGDWTVHRSHDLAEKIIDDLVAAVPDIRVSVHVEPIEDPKSYEDVTDF